jgi:hypothetical protein
MRYLINEEFWIFEKIHPSLILCSIESRADIIIIEEDFSLFFTLCECFNVPLFQYFNVSMFQCFNVSMNILCISKTLICLHPEQSISQLSYTLAIQIKSWILRLESKLKVEIFIYMKKFKYD